MTNPDDALALKEKAGKLIRAQQRPDTAAVPQAGLVTQRGMRPRSRDQDPPHRKQHENEASKGDASKGALEGDASKGDASEGDASKGDASKGVSQQLLSLLAQAMVSVSTGSLHERSNRYVSSANRIEQPMSDAMSLEESEPQVVTLKLLRFPALATGSAPALLLSRKDAAMLAVLALDGACARDTLALMLWPGAGIEHARASLRQRRFRLARGAGTVVVEGGEMLRLASNVIHPALNPYDRLELDPTAWDGELLDGLMYDDCPEFERWLKPARTRLNQLKAQALDLIATRLEAELRRPPKVALAQRLATKGLLPAAGHTKQPMSVKQMNKLGAQPVTAMDVYRTFTSQLRIELDALSLDKAAALAAKLVDGQRHVVRASDDES